MLFEHIENGQLLDWTQTRVAEVNETIGVVMLSCDYVSATTF
jgi:hypothetical protein